MDNLEIARNPKLLQKLTCQEGEFVSYAEQIERLKMMRASSTELGKAERANRVNVVDKATLKLILG